VKRVYLDQKDWIYLARAYHGQPGGKRYRDALAVAQAGVDAGLVSFPLSSAHYKEIARRRDWHSRYRLAEVMGALSGFHAIASLIEIVPAELDRALHARFGRPLELLPLRPFGFGVGFAFGDPDLRYKAPEWLPEATNRHELETVLQVPFEEAMLRGPAEDEPQDFPAHIAIHDGYAKGQNERGELLRTWGFDKGDKLERATLGKVWVDILEPFNEALRRARVSDEDFTTREQLTSLLQDVPTEWIVYEFERARHACEGVWERGDLSDICALSVAVVYCDVVVTEKQWVHILRRAGLDEANDTVLTDDVADLPEILVAGSVSAA
jgi:hypothetical protein